MGEPGHTGLAPRDAVALIHEARQAEAGVRARFEGQVWMMWGFALAGIQVTYGLAGAVLVSEGGSWPWWGNLLWLPWTAAAVAGNWAAFRAAELHTGQALWGSPWHALVWAGLITLAWAVAAVLDHPINELVYSILVYGSVLVLVGWTNLFRYSPSGRRVALAAGTVILAAGLACAVLQVGYATATIVGAATSGAALVTGGIVQSLKG